MDRIDREILAALVRDGRQSWQDLAASVRLGPAATAERVRRLRARGVLRGFAADVDPAALGRPLELVADITLTAAAADRFEAALAGIPAVVDAVHLTGPSDYVLRLRCADPADIDATVRRLKEAGAARTETRLVLRRVADIDPAGPISAPGGGRSDGPGS